MIEGVGGLSEVEDILGTSVNTAKIVGWFTHVAIVFTGMVIAAKVKLEIVYRCGSLYGPGV